MNCPNCNTKITKSLLKSNFLFPEHNIKLINSQLGLTSSGYCTNCGHELLVKAKAKKESEIEPPEIKQKRQNLKNILKSKKNELFRKSYSMIIEFGDSIPVLTTHTPYKWEYTSLGIVTGQTVMGTGFFTEIFAGVTDFLGARSTEFSEKLNKGESEVLNILRAKSISIGGNAVIATDIDYGEVGALKGMLMVCAAGTAVDCYNWGISEEKQEKMNKLENERLTHKDLRVEISEIEKLSTHAYLTNVYLANASDADDFFQEYEKFATKYNIT